MADLQSNWRGCATKLLWKEDHHALDKERSDLIPKREPHPLSSQIHRMSHSDAGRRVEEMIEKYKADTCNRFKRVMPTVHGHAMSRIEVQRSEKRKKNVHILRSRLEENATKCLSRAVNTVRFRVPSASHATKDMSEIDFPIPLGEHDMNPELLLRLSCEQAWLDHGRQSLISMAMSEISKNMLVLTFWFVHCRFFQVRTFAK